MFYFFLLFLILTWQCLFDSAAAAVCAILPRIQCSATCSAWTLVWVKKYEPTFCSCAQKCTSFIFHSVACVCVKNYILLFCKCCAAFERISFCCCVFGIFLQCSFFGTSVFFYDVAIVQKTCLFFHNVSIVFKDLCFFRQCCYCIWRLLFLHMVGTCTFFQLLFFYLSPLKSIISTPYHFLFSMLVHFYYLSFSWNIFLSLNVRYMISVRHGQNNNVINSVYTKWFSDTLALNSSCYRQGGLRNNFVTPCTIVVGQVWGFNPVRSLAIFAVKNYSKCFSSVHKYTYVLYRGVSSFQWFLNCWGDPSPKTEKKGTGWSCHQFYVIQIPCNVLQVFCTYITYNISSASLAAIFSKLGVSVFSKY